MDPLRPALLVQLVLLDRGHHSLAVGADEVGQGVVAGLGEFLRAFHLELNDDFFLEEEVLKVLVGHALKELLPDGEFVLIFLEAD
jgi:hypothetical protein